MFDGTFASVIHLDTERLSTPYTNTIHELECDSEESDDDDDDDDDDNEDDDDSHGGSDDSSNDRSEDDEEYSNSILVTVNKVNPTFSGNNFLPEEEAAFTVTNPLLSKDEDPLMVLTRDTFAYLLCEAKKPLDELQLVELYFREEKEQKIIQELNLCQDLGMSKDTEMDVTKLKMWGIFEERTKPRVDYVLAYHGRNCTTIIYLCSQKDGKGFEKTRWVFESGSQVKQLRTHTLWNYKYLI